MPKPIAKFKGTRLVDKLYLFHIRKVPDHFCKLRIVLWMGAKVFKERVGITDRYGSKYYLPVNEFIGSRIVFYDEFEPATLDRCEQLLRNGGTLIDIGANVGLYSVYLSKLKDVNVYAVEPAVANFTKLQEHVIINNLENIHLLNVALSKKGSFGYLNNFHPDNSGTARIDEDVKAPNAYLVRLCTLSELVEHLELKHIDLIKMDIEGFEMNVFEEYFKNGASIMPENIIIEFNHLIERTGYTRLQCYEFFKKIGYEVLNIYGQEYRVGDELPEFNLWLKRRQSEVII